MLTKYIIEAIIAHNRFIYKAHRALNDVMALTNMLVLQPQLFIDLRRSAANKFTVLAVPESTLKNNEKDRETISKMGFFKTHPSIYIYSLRRTRTKFTVRKYLYKNLRSKNCSLNSQYQVHHAEKVDQDS